MFNLDLQLTKRAGSAKAVNIALMGCLSTYYPDIPEEAWLQAMEAVVPEKFLELNKKVQELYLLHQGN